MSVRRIITGAATGALLLIASAGPAFAAASSTIGDVEVADGQLSFVVTLDGVPTGATIETDDASVSLEGQTLDPSVQSLSDADDVTQTALLVMDTSDSMAGEKLAAAQNAARQFVSAVPSEVEIGLVTFDSVAELQVPPTTNRSNLLDTIDGLTTAPQTVLYDAVVVAAVELLSADVGSALLLSDGADRGSAATIEEATKAAKKSDARFDVVSFGDSTEQVAALTDIAVATDGTVYEAADTEQLAEAFDQAATTLSNRFLMTADLPDGYTQTSGTLTATIPVDGAPVTDAAQVVLGAPLAAGPDDVPPPLPTADPGPLTTLANNVIWLAVGAVFVAMFIILYIAIAAGTNPERNQSGGVRRRLSIYTLGGKAPVKEQETTVLGDTQVARSAVEFAGRVVARRDFESTLGAKLESAAVPLKPAEWLLIHVGITLGAGLVAFLLTSGRLLLTLVAIGLGMVLPWMYLTFKAGQRRKAFMAALPDTLQLMAGSLSAGYSMPQAVDTVVREGKPPISTEFNRALVETRLGVDLEDALDGIAERMQSVDFAWVVMAIRIQREVGGNLAEVLTTVSATLRERERLRRQVQVLSAEGRLSAWILGLLPIVFALYLVLVRPEYLEPLITTAFGWLLLGTGTVLLVVGGLWLRKVVKVEV
ncbi:MAG: type II secretion system F family protein [Actinomycetia bacterium]|nr:type II secretion system F family protein [Actinomycetes bacterium]